MGPNLFAWRALIRPSAGWSAAASEPAARATGSPSGSALAEVPIVATEKIVLPVPGGPRTTVTCK
eukprot:2679097-Pyramimonas_sp.AAC.1